MKKIVGLALVFAAVLSLAIGCANTVEKAEPTATASTTSRFESYVTQTSFRFPKSWAYQTDEDIDEGMTALFIFDAGRAAVQFLWMDETQAQQNVFLQQIEMDDVRSDEYTAGPYTGTLISGVEEQTYTAAFEGCRDWYNVGPKLYLRAVIEVQGADAYAAEYQRFLDLLASVTITQDEDLTPVDDSTLETYDFVEDFGLKVTVTNSWWLTPDYDFENSLIILEFEAATGGNIYRVETGTLSETEYDEMVQSLKDLEQYEDVYDYMYSQENGEIEVVCLQEGKINRVRLTSIESGERIRYLWVSSAFRPLLDEAYYQTVVVPSIDSINWI